MTPAIVERAADLVRKGDSVKQVAASLGVPAVQLSKALHTIGVDPRKHSPAYRAREYFLAHPDMPLPSIATICRCSEACVYNATRDLRQGRQLGTKGLRDLLRVGDTVTVSRVAQRFRQSDALVGVCTGFTIGGTQPVLDLGQIAWKDIQTITRKGKRLYDKQ